MAGSAVVTGVSSFVGIHVALALAQRGYQVVGTHSRAIAEYEGAPRTRLERAREGGVLLEECDITHAADLAALVERRQPGVCVHHAGWVRGYGGSDYDYVKGHAVNVAPLDALFAALSKSGCRGIVLTGSSAEYPDGSRAARESNGGRPATPYGLSKLEETWRAAQLADLRRLPTRVARLFIPYGALDSPQKVIPSVVSALRRGEPVDLSPCDQRRDVVFVGDVADAYVRLVEDLQRPTLFDVFNLCAGRATPVRTVLSAVARCLGADPALLRFGARPRRPGEPDVSYGANGKARRILGWRPRPLQAGLAAYLRGPPASSQGLA